VEGSGAWLQSGKGVRARGKQDSPADEEDKTWSRFCLRDALPRDSVAVIGGARLPSKNLGPGPSQRLH
jgi:hypothetical protein